MDYTVLIPHKPHNQNKLQLTIYTSNPLWRVSPFWLMNVTLCLSIPMFLTALRAKPTAIVYIVRAREDMTAMLAT